MLSTLLILAIIQGISLIVYDEERELERDKRRKDREKEKQKQKA